MKSRICPAHVACPFCDYPEGEWIPTQWRTVKAGSWLERFLIRVSRSRSVKTNAYRRALKKVPKHSPLYGGCRVIPRERRSWSRVNGRRLDLIELEAELAKGGNELTPAQAEELEALQAVPHGGCKAMKVDLLLFARLWRRMRAHGFRDAGGTPVPRLKGGKAGG